MYEIKLEGFVLLNPKRKTDELKKGDYELTRKRRQRRHIFHVLKHYSIKGQILLFPYHGHFES